MEAITPDVARNVPHAFLALSSVFAFASPFSEGNVKQLNQFFRHLNRIMSGFGESKSISMFLLKTPSQQFSSSR
jgi:hypothetical protein